MAEQIATVGLEVGNVAKIVVRNYSGQYLVLRSSEWPERPDRSLQPDLAGGEVDEGESHRQGAKRELQEEAGIDLAEEDLLPVFAETFILGSIKSINRMIFFAEVPDDTEVILSSEHDQYQWVSAKELVDMKWREPYPKIFEYLIQIGVIEID